MLSTNHRSTDLRPFLLNGDNSTSSVVSGALDLNIRCPDESGCSFRALFFIFGQVPMSIFFLMSMPCGMFGCASSKENRLAIVAAAATLNSIIVLVLTWRFAGFSSSVSTACVYMLCLSLLWSIKAILRKWYGQRIYSFDQDLFLIFGIHLIRRGRAFVYAYPLIAALPTLLWYVVSSWVTRSHFLMECQPDANQTAAFDVTRCAPMYDTWDITHAMPYILSNGFAMYGVIKVLTARLIQLDPETSATLSDMQAWESKRLGGLDGDVDRDDVC